MRLLSFRKLFVTCSCCCFFFCFLGGIVREKRGGREGRGEDAWSVSTKVYNFAQRTKSCHKFKCFQVKPHALVSNLRK